MIQFLNNIWIALSSENPELLSFLLIPAGIVEAYLLMKLFLIILDIKSTRKQRVIYTLLFTLTGIICNFLVPNPINVLTNYILTIIFIKLIFKINWLKSFIALIVPTFIFVLLNILIQKPYLKIFNINSNTYMNTPIYRILYLFILYSIMFVVCYIIKKLQKIKFKLELLDNLDKKTRVLIYANLLIGFLALSVQLVTTTFYIDIVPTIISILNFILLLSFLMLSVYSFTRMIKLSITRRNLASAEEYNKSLEILYDKVKGFNHDFNNIVSTLDGFIENNDISGLKEYFKDVKKDCKITNNLSILNPRIINNPGIYSLLNNKYFKATNSGVTVELEFFLDLNSLPINTYEFSRMLGILLDNAIEEAEKCEKKLIKISFIRDSKNKRAILTIKNTYSNKDVNTEKIFDKGISGKQNHSGIGLWEVRNYISKNKNLDLFTSKTDEFFSQELAIYDV